MCAGIMNVPLRSRLWKPCPHLQRVCKWGDPVQSNHLEAKGKPFRAVPSTTKTGKAEAQQMESLWKCERRKTPGDILNTCLMPSRITRDHALSPNGGKQDAPQSRRFLLPGLAELNLPWDKGVPRSPLHQGSVREFTSYVVILLVREVGNANWNDPDLLVSLQQIPRFIPIFPEHQQVRRWMQRAKRPFPSKRSTCRHGAQTPRWRRSRSPGVGAWIEEAGPLSRQLTTMVVTRECVQPIQVG